MNIAIDLYEKTREYRWKQLAEEIVYNIMYLQDNCGGFIHGAGEFEPVYCPTSTCPIHQCEPILALLNYAGKPYANSEINSQIKVTVDKHWKWFNDFYWKRGNGGIWLIDN